MRNGTLRAVAISIALAVALIAVITAVLWWKYNDIITAAELSVAKPPGAPHAAPQANAPGTTASAPAATSESTKTVETSKDGLETVVTERTVTTEKITTTRPLRTEAKNGTAEKPKGTPKKRGASTPRAAKATVHSPAVASATSEWRHWGADPHADSFEEACRNRSRDIDSSSMPEGAKIKLKQRIAPNCENWTETYLTPNTQLAEMWSGKYTSGKTPRIMQAPLVAAIPVAIGPDGRQYRKGSVFQTARAAMWQVEHEGKTYYWYIMFACFNSAWRMAPIALARQPLQCAYVNYTVRPGDQVWFGIFSRARLPASPCWEFCDGPHCTALPSGCLNCDWAGVREDIPHDRDARLTGHYIAQYPNQRIRGPLEMREQFFALCANREGEGQANGAVIRPEYWGSNLSVRVSSTEFPQFGRPATSITKKVLHGRQIE